MRLLTPFIILAALLPAALLAQNHPLPTDSTLTEPDQELDDFSGGFAGTHRITPTLRGVRAANRVVYWVSADGRRLAAFRDGKRLWTTNVAAPFEAEIPTAHIRAMTLATTTIFVSFALRGMAEIDRKTGRIAAKYFDRDPHRLGAEPK